MKEIMSYSLKKLDEKSIYKISGGAPRTYEWTCPECGKKFSGEVANATLVRIRDNNSSWMNCCGSCLGKRIDTMERGDGYIEGSTGKFIKGPMPLRLKSSDKKKI